MHHSHIASKSRFSWPRLLDARKGFSAEEVRELLGRAAPRLASVVYWYCQGLSAADIGRRISPFGGAWDANRALDAAASLIADALNRSDPAGVAA